MKNIDITESIVKKVGLIAEETGFEVYAVGGYVRDKILGKDSKDIDFVVVGDSIRFANIAAKKLNRKKVITYPRFKTAKIPSKSYDIEFVSARSEIYDEKSRKPIVLDATLESDLARRDFTINTLAVKINGSDIGQIIDSFGGVQSIADGIIKTPLEPNVTYSDDPLRMMRAVRFAARFNYEIESESFEAIKSNADRIKIVSPERIGDEFFKILLSANPVYGLRLLEKSGLLREIFPELTDLKGVEVIDGIGHKDNFEHSLKVFDNICQVSDKLNLRLAALMHDIGKPRVKYFKKNFGWTFHGHDDKGSKMFKKLAGRMKWSNEVVEYVSEMIRLHHRPISLTKECVTDSGVRRFLFEGREKVDDLMKLCRADITTANKSKLAKYLNNFERLSQLMVEVEEKDRLRNFKPPVDGVDIMNFFQITQGCQVGIIKKIIVDAILDGKIENDRDAAMVLLKKIKESGKFSE